MAEVPTYDSPRVMPQVTQSGNLSGINADVFGEGIGRAISNIGGALGDYARREDRFADEMKANDVAAQAMDWKQQALLHPQNGLLNQGFNDTDNLQAASDKVLSSFSEQSSKWMDGLNNDRQREMAQRHLGAIRSSLEDAIYGYEKQQGDRIVVSKTSNAIKLLQQDAANFYNDLAPPGDETAPTPNPDQPKDITNPALVPATKDMVTASLERQHQLINDAAQHLGWTNDQRDEAIAQADSKTHVNVINSMLTNAASGKMDANQISKYFDKNQESIFPQERKTLAASIESAVVNQGAGALTNKLIYDDKGLPKDEATILADLVSSKKGLEPKMYGAVRQQVDQYLADSTKAKDALTKQNYDAARQILIQNAGNIAALPAQLKTALERDPDHWLDIQRQAEQFRNARLPMDGTDAFYSLRTAIVTNGVYNGKRAVDVSPDTYRSLVSPNNFNELSKLRDEVLSKPGAGTEGLDLASTKEEILQTALSAKGLKLKPFNPDGTPNPDTANFNRLVDRYVEANGGMKKIGTKGYQEAVDQISMHYVIKSKAWTGPNNVVPDWETNVAFNISQVPATDVQRIKSKLRAGEYLSDNDIIERYNESLNQAQGPTNAPGQQPMRDVSSFSNTPEHYHGGD